jgi:hypothetical protein
VPRFSAAEIVESTWCVVQPALHDPGDAVASFRGSWCPTDAADIPLSGDHRFQRNPS